MISETSSDPKPKLIGLMKMVWRVLPHVERKRLLGLFGLMLSVAMLEIGSLVMIQYYLRFIAGGVVPQNALASIWLTDFSVRQQILVLSAAVLVILVLKLLAGLIMNRVLAITVARNTTNLARRLFSAYQFAPFTWHGKRNTSHLQNSITQDTVIIANGLTLQFLQLTLNGILALAVMSFILTALSFKLLLVITALAVSLWLVGTMAQKILIKAGTQVREAQQDILQVVEEGIGALTEVRILGHGDLFVARLSRHLAKRAWGQKRRLFYSQVVPLLLENIVLAALIAIVAFMAVTMDDLETVFATASVLTIALFRLRQVLTKIVVSINSIGVSSAALPPVVADLEELEPLAGLIPKPVPAPQDGFEELRFEEVSFVFPNQESPAIHAFSTALKRGEHLAIMGQTGAGKSTFLSLLLGLLPPGAGRIDLDGRSLAESIAAWNAQIGYVPQAVFLIDDTVAANVAFGVPEKARDIQRLRTALERAQALDFVDALPSGIDTQIGQGGSSLSGGQRQRLGIARALYRQPTVLVLDEATSALDRDTQFRVMKSVSSLPSNPTVISVTHQLEPLDFADRLLLLEAGRVVADGPIDEVRKTEAFRKIALVDGPQEEATT